MAQNLAGETFLEGLTGSLERSPDPLQHTTWFILCPLLSPFFFIIGQSQIWVGVGLVCVGGGAVGLSDNSKEVSDHWVGMRPKSHGLSWVSVHLLELPHPFCPLLLRLKWTNTPGRLTSPARMALLRYLTCNHVISYSWPVLAQVNLIIAMTAMAARIMLNWRRKHRTRCGA